MLEFEERDEEEETEELADDEDFEDDDEHFRQCESCCRSKVLTLRHRPLT